MSITPNLSPSSRFLIVDERDCEDSIRFNPFRGEGNHQPVVLPDGDVQTKASAEQLFSQNSPMSQITRNPLPERKYIESPLLRRLFQEKPLSQAELVERFGDQLNSGRVTELQRSLTEKEDALEKQKKECELMCTKYKELVSQNSELQSKLQTITQEFDISNDQLRNSQEVHKALQEEHESRLGRYQKLKEVAILDKQLLLRYRNERNEARKTLENRVFEDAEQSNKRARVVENLTSTNSHLEEENSNLKETLASTIRVLENTSNGLTELKRNNEQVVAQKNLLITRYEKLKCRYESDVNHSKRKRDDQR